jgi:hypothetical protein
MEEERPWRVDQLRRALDAVPDDTPVAVNIPVRLPGQSGTRSIKVALLAAHVQAGDGSHTDLLALEIDEPAGMIIWVPDSC